MLILLTCMAEPVQIHSGKMLFPNSANASRLSRNMLLQEVSRLISEEKVEVEPRDDLPNLVKITLISTLESFILNSIAATIVINLSNH